jgi:hypothetical protein
MAETEIIQDSGAKVQLLEELKESRIPVQMLLLDGDYDRITHVNGIRNRRGAVYFRTEFVQSFASEWVGRNRGSAGLRFLEKTISNMSSEHAAGRLLGTASGTNSGDYRKKAAAEVFQTGTTPSNRRVFNRRFGSI